MRVSEAKLSRRPSGSTPRLLGGGLKLSPLGLIPEAWHVLLLDSIAKRGSGHTPSKRFPAYWGGPIKWVSLQDSPNLDRRYIRDTAATITEAGLANSSAVLHPAGVVVLSRDAGVGKSAIITEPMAVSQHFMAWACSADLNNHFLYYWFQHEKPKFERIAVGNTIKTIGLQYFREYVLPVPPRAEQDAIVGALSDADTLIESLERLIAKKRAIKQVAMQELLTGNRRLPGFTGEWAIRSLGQYGEVYGGLSGKTKRDFGHGEALYVPFMSIMSNVRVDLGSLQHVSVFPDENQSLVRAGDLLFNGSSETPDEIAMCSLVSHDIDRMFLNSFCFGYRFTEPHRSDPLYFAYFFRSPPGRALVAHLAQGAIRYNVSKSALLATRFRQPDLSEQQAISALLSDMDTELETLESKLTKARQIKQGMMQELLTGRVRLV